MDEIKDKKVAVRFNPSLIQRIREAANKRHIMISRFIRIACKKEADRILGPEQ